MINDVTETNMVHAIEMKLEERQWTFKLNLDHVAVDCTLMHMLHVYIY